MSEYDPNNIVPYPLDLALVDATFTDAEEAYEIDPEKYILQGVINPRFKRWYEEDNRNDAPLDNEMDLKVRYRACKLCPMFDQEKKICDECNCFMPIKVQFKKYSCPLNKWDAKI
jgi:hypothetical protein